MSLGNRALQVHSQQQSEHISLDALNHEFQEVQEQAQSTGSNSSQLADTTQSLNHVGHHAGCNHQRQVTTEHGREET